MLSKFPKIKFNLGLVDINGSVATFNVNTKKWTVIYVGEFKNGSFDGYGKMSFGEKSDYIKYDGTFKKYKTISMAYIFLSCQL